MNNLIEQINSFTITNEFQVKEIIISASETDELILTTKSKYPITLDLTNEKCNASSNRNRGWKKVKGDWIVFLDCDDMYHPDKIIVTHTALVKNPEVDCIIHTLKYAYLMDDSYSRRIHDIKIIPSDEIKKETFPGGTWYESNSLKMPANFSGIIGYGISTVRASSEIRFKEELHNGEDRYFCRQHAFNSKLICIDNILMQYNKYIHPKYINKYYGYSFNGRGVGGVGAIIHDIMNAAVYAEYSNLDLVFIDEGYEIPLFNGSINDTDEPNKTWHSFFNSFEIKSKDECREIWPKCPQNFTNMEYGISEYANILQTRVCKFKPEIEEEINELVKKTPFNCKTDLVLHIRRMDKITEMNKLITDETYIDECENMLSIYKKELTRIYICTDDQSCCLKIRDHFAKKNIEVVWDTNESTRPLHILKLRCELEKSVAQQELFNAFKNIVIMRDAKYLIGARSSYFFRIGELLRFPKRCSNLQDSEHFGVARYSSDNSIVRPYFKKTYTNFINTNVINNETVVKYNKLLKEDKIINIPNAILSNFLNLARPLLENYNFWEYSIKYSTSNGPISIKDVNNPEIHEHFKKCKSDYESCLFSYRFKRSKIESHNKDCDCFACNITDTLKSFTYTDLLSKIVGCKSLIPGEIFLSKYEEGDFLNMHHDKNKGDVAVTVCFTYDWDPTYGGVLHFTDNDNNIFKSVVPKAGDINIFLLEPGKGLNHFVSTISANKNRFMISSWYTIVREPVINPFQNIHFCSFGSKPYASSEQAFYGSKGYDIALKRLEKQARNSQFFTSVDIYNEDTVPGLGFYSNFIENNKRGYGYWLWKPLVILHMMSKYEKDSIIIYADAGFEVIRNNSTIELFNKYINDVNTHESHRLGFLDKNLECEYTKQDLFDYMELNDDTYKNSKQLLGGIQILLNTDKNKKFIQEWLRIASKDDYHFLDDSPSISPNSNKFIEHRHDQSIMSLLKKKYGFCEEECFGTLIPEYGATPIRYLPIHPSWKRRS